MSCSLSYMSCNGVSLNSDSRFFSFKAGAYGPDSGVSLRSDYRAMAEAGRLDGKKMADALEFADRNADAGVESRYCFSTRSEPKDRSES